MELAFQQLATIALTIDVRLAKIVKGVGNKGKGDRVIIRGG